MHDHSFIHSFPSIALLRPADRQWVFHGAISPIHLYSSPRAVQGSGTPYRTVVSDLKAAISSNKVGRAVKLLATLRELCMYTADREAFDAELLRMLLDVMPQVGHSCHRIELLGYSCHRIELLGLCSGMYTEGGGPDEGRLVQLRGLVSWADIVLGFGRREWERG
jgi:hypothetical protein